MPNSLSPADIASHGQQFFEYTQWDEVQNFVRKHLSTDAEGWVSPEADWPNKKLQNKMLLNLIVERLDTQKATEEVTQMWPFLTQQPFTISEDSHIRKQR